MTDPVLAEAAVAEAPGVWSIREPFPDNPLSYTLVYALETAAGGPKDSMPGMRPMSTSKGSQATSRRR